MIVVGVMFTAGGRRGLRRVHSVLNDSCRIISLGRVKYSISVPRAKGALRRGTLRGTRCICSRCRLDYFTSSANLRIRTLSNTPNIRDTHCTRNASRSDRTGVTGLLERLSKGRGEGTHFHAIVYCVRGGSIYPYNYADVGGVRRFSNVMGNSVTARGRNARNFNCSPVFIPRNCSRDFTRLNRRVGGNVDRETETITGLTRCLGGGGSWCPFSVGPCVWWYVH